MYYVTFKFTSCYTHHWPPRSRSYPQLFYNDHMDNLPAANLASPPFLWYSFPSQSANTLCLHLGLIFTQESFNFEMINYNIYFLSTTIWHSIFLPEFPQNTDPLSSSGAWLQMSFSVSQLFLSSLPSHGIEVLWYVYLFGHILGNILGSPSPPVAAIWQNHSPGEIQTFVSYLYLDSRSCWRK